MFLVDEFPVRLPPALNEVVVLTLGVRRETNKGLA